MGPRHVGTTEEIDARVHQVQRRWRMLAGTAAVIGGVVGLLWPHNALRLVALLFGIYLIVVGVSRITGSVSAQTSRGSRAVQIILGVLVVFAGVLCLNNPFGSVAALTWLIGLGWLIDGVATVLSTFLGSERPSDGSVPPRPRGRWLLIVGGVVSVIAGIVLIAMPYEAVRSLLFVASILLLGVGVVTLLVALIRPAANT